MSNIMDLAKSIQEHHGLTVEEAQAFIRRAVDVINDGLQADRQVKLKGLGTFKVMAVSSRKSVDVNTGEHIIIDGRDKISFTPENSMRDLVNRPFAQFETVVVNDEVDFNEIDKAMGTEAMSEELEIREKPYIPQPVAAAISPLVELADMESLGEIDKELAHDEESQPPIAHVSESKKQPVMEPSVTVSEQADMAGTAAESLQLNVTGSDEYAGQDALDVSDKITDVEEESVAVEKEQEENVVEEQPLRRDEQDIEQKETPLMVAQIPLDSSDAEETRVQEPQKTEKEEMHMDEEQEASAVRNAHMLEQKVSKNKRIITLLAAACILLFLFSVGGFLYMNHQLQLRDHRLDHMLAMVQTREKPQQVLKTAKHQPAPAAVAPLVEQKKVVPEKQLAQNASENKIPVAASIPSNRSVANDETSKTETSMKAVESKQQSPYDADPRVRTGAYRITGVDRFVKVRKGQTLKSISKANLGPGMECYLEAVNPGVSELKEGQMIKIPALELKKKR